MHNFLHEPRLGVNLSLSLILHKRKDLVDTCRQFVVDSVIGVDGVLVMVKIINLGITPVQRPRAISPADEDQRMDRELRELAEMCRRKLVAIRGPAWAREVLASELRNIPADCQGE